MQFIFFLLHARGFISGLSFSLEEAVAMTIALLHNMLNQMVSERSRRLKDIFTPQQFFIF